MMQQQMMMQQKINDERDIKRKNIIFDNSRGMKINIAAKYGTKVKDVLKQYIEKIYGFQNNKKLIFLYNAKQINQNELEAVENYFISDDIPLIQVLEI